MEQMALAAPGGDHSLWSLFMQAGWVVKLVMLGLLAASVWTWAIIVDKMLAYARMRSALSRFEEIFWSGQSLEELYRTLAERKTSGMGAVFVAAMREWKKSFEKGVKSPIGLQNRIDKAMDLALTREMEQLESRLGFLASVGSAAPFIGLFGTVVGIMTSFQAIAASGATNLAVVAPGIACDCAWSARSYPCNHRIQQAVIGRREDRAPHGRLCRRVLRHSVSADR
jgi:biopolymer transport protein TolQ